MRPVLILDGETLTDALAENNPEFASTNEDATVRLTGTAGSARPEVVPGSTGRGVDSEQVVNEILADLRGEQTRAITVELHEVEPEVTTEDAEAWDVNHVDAEYATHTHRTTARTATCASAQTGSTAPWSCPAKNSIWTYPGADYRGQRLPLIRCCRIRGDHQRNRWRTVPSPPWPNAGFLGGMEIIEHKPTPLV